MARAPLQELRSLEGAAKDTLTGCGAPHTTVATLAADSRCSSAILDYPCNTDVGRLVPREKEGEE